MLRGTALLIADAALALAALAALAAAALPRPASAASADARSEEHTSEFQSHLNLVCRLLLEKKK